MVSFLKKLISVVFVLWIVALILNLKIGGRGTREWTADLWNSQAVQKVYTTVRDRILALVRKDISVEEVFKPELPGEKRTDTPAGAEPKKEDVQFIHMEKLDEKDRQELEKILDKAK